jgi:hypothetical protein
VVVQPHPFVIAAVVIFVRPTAASTATDQTVNKVGFFRGELTIVHTEAGTARLRAIESQVTSPMDDEQASNITTVERSSRAMTLVGQPDRETL